MHTAYIMVNTNMGAETKVTNDLRKFEAVKEIYGVYGVYDLVVKVEAETVEKLKMAISDNIRTIENIRTTLSMIVVK